jgi:hypothetical protein
MRLRLIDDSSPAYLRANLDRYRPLIADEAALASYAMLASHPRPLASAG